MKIFLPDKEPLKVRASVGFSTPLPSGTLSHPTQGGTRPCAGGNPGPEEGDGMGQRCRAGVWETEGE